MNIKNRLDADSVYMFDGKEFRTRLQIALHYGVSETAVRNNLVFDEDGNVTYKEGVTDLRALRKRGEGNLDNATYEYEGLTFFGYGELSKYVGVPVKFLRINVKTSDRISEYVKKYREENYPYEVKGERFPSIAAVSKRFNVKVSVFYKCELTSEAITKRLDEHLATLESGEDTEVCIEFRGENYANLMEISLAYNLDVRALLDAYREGEDLDGVTKPGFWGLDTDRSKLFTPPSFYELNKNI